MYKKSLFSNSSEYLKTSIQEITNVYELCDDDPELTKNKLSEKYQEKEIQTIINSVEKIKNPNPRLLIYQRILRYLLWTVLLLTAFQIPFLYFETDITPLVSIGGALIGLLPFVIALVIFYSKYSSRYEIILIIYGILIFIFPNFDGLIDAIFEFSVEPVYLLFFSLYLILTISKIAVIYYSYKLLKIDDKITRIVASTLNLRAQDC